MKRTHIAAVAVLILTVGFLLGAQKPKTQWEYARLTFDRIQGWNWMAPDMALEATRLSDLSRSLGIEVSSKTEGVYAVTDWAGANGWELIVLNQTPQHAVAWFKRPQ